ncbi:MAG TPA: hypothetical protein VLB76_05610 [Thermoanaerobaculia bacterium]|jgi:hypothetical protein|nr:hypothetical protein [Thermoanaerobaculia bacterium]
MSLISDALKRARQEAARQDSLRQGVPYAMGVADPPVRRTPWISLLAGLGAGCILAAAVFALAFFAGWGPSRKPAVETRTAEIPAAAAPQSPSAAPVAAPVVEPAALPIAPPQEKTAPAPPPKPVPEPPRVIEERRPTPQIEVTPPVVRRPPPETVPAAPAPAPAPTTEVERPAPAPVPAAPAENSGSLVEGQVYTGEVPVPGGGSLKLNGIVFSQDHPIAVLDGRVMGPGESVQGFTVVAIESGRVKLQGHGTTVYLSPK